jgi:hypothetical protein
MAVDERQRLQLAEAAKAAFGADAGITLMELLPPVGWADVATKQDLRQELAALELRFEAKLERSVRQLVLAMTSLMVAGMATTVAVAFAR